MERPTDILFREFNPQQRWFQKKKVVAPAGKVVGIASWFGPSEPVVSKIGDVFGVNIDGDLLRFWAAQLTSESRKHSCRVCHALVWSKEDRAKHKKEQPTNGSCNEIARDSMAWLCKWDRCATCGQACKRRKWGVPLHRFECELRWIFNPFSLVWLSVMRLAKDKGNPLGAHGKAYVQKAL